MMSTPQKEMYIKIGKVLWENWDPIGINDYTDASDEYDSYTPIIFQMANQQADQETIADKLYQIERERMGLFGNLSLIHI